MEKQLRRKLIAAAKSYAKASGLAMTTVGLRYANDAYFFERIKTHTFTVRKYDEVMKRLGKE